MPQVKAEASQVIEAAPEKVFGIIRDYQKWHPRILPSQYFRNLKVEEGGLGAGTVVSFQTVVGGQTRSWRTRVEEPEPGRVLTEHDLNSDTVTIFTVTPSGDGQQSKVLISSVWTGNIVEKLLAPAMLRKVYEAELQQLNSVAKGG